MTAARATISVLATLLLPACTAEPGGDPSHHSTATGAGFSQTESWFDVHHDSGIDFVLSSGASSKQCYLPEIVCGGVGLIDYDNDGRLDVFLVQGGALREGGPKLSNRLYRNLGDTRFQDVTEQVGLVEEKYGMGCAIGDFDADGDSDIFVTNVGPNSLWRNDGGKFVDVASETGVADPSFGASAVFADYDLDGDLDLFVTNYVLWSASSEITCRNPDGLPDYCQPNNYQAPAPDLLYRNDSSRFVNVTKVAGIDQAFGNGLGVVAGDFDANGSLDFYVANDAMSNQLWLQKSPGQFENKAIPRGVAVNASGKMEAGMGVVCFDFGADEDLDLFLSHLSQETNTLYENEGAYFEDSTDTLGLGMSSKQHTGFGVGLADFDLDGHLDLYVANGRVQRPSVPVRGSDPYAQENLLYSGLGHRFEVVSPPGGTVEDVVRTSRGAAFGDLDGDADIDAVIQNRDASVTVLINRWADLGRSGILLDLRREDGRIAIGARARIRQGEQWSEWRRCDPASGYCSSQDHRVHFGLSTHRKADALEVQWTNGTVKTYGELQAGVHRITSDDRR